MRSVEASGKTREEAIQSALNELGVEMYEVDRIEILNEGSKGLFGFGARPVQVRLTVEKLAPAGTRAARQDSEEPSRDERRARPEREGRRDERSPRPERAPREKRNDEPRAQQSRGQREEKRSPRSQDPGAAAQEPQAENSERGERGERGGRNRRRRGRNGRDRAEAGERGEQSARSEQPARERQPREQRAPRERAQQENPPRRERAAAQEEVAFEPITDAQGAEAAALLQQIIEKMGMASEVTFSRAGDSSPRLVVKAEDGAILIGRKGRTLSALQYLINRIITRGDTAENTERLVVDVEGYVDRRRESLESLARNFAEKAKATGRNFRLKPMSPQERRIIHLTLQEDPEIRTFSLGESLFRSVVISPKNGESGGREGNYRSGRSRGGRNRGGRGRNQGGGRHHDRDYDAGAVSD